MNQVRCGFSLIRGFRFLAFLWVFLTLGFVGKAAEIKVGLAETDITPPADYPLIGHFQPRNGTSAKDPLKARVMYLSDGTTEVALVFCDLGGISVDLANEVRQRASAKSGIRRDNILLVASQCQGAPDYALELWHELAPDGPKPFLGAKPPAYALGLIDKLVEVVGDAKKCAVPSEIATGRAVQKTPISFSKRILQRDGTVKDGGKGALKEPGAVKVAGPIDPEVSILSSRPVSGTGTKGILTNFALHACTHDGPEYSADFPNQLEKGLKKALGESTVSLFGVGCSADLHHLDPDGAIETTTESIGLSLAGTVQGAMTGLVAPKDLKIRVRSHTVQLPLHEVAPVDAMTAGQKLMSIRLGEKLTFLDHLHAYKLVLLDQYHHDHPYVEGHKHLRAGISHSWKGVGESIPVKIHMVCLGSDIAILFLPGEVFTELGLAIKQGSPFPTTMVMQMALASETTVIATRAAYAQGGNEVAGSILKPGAGERLVESALGMIRETSKEIFAVENGKPKP